MKLTEKQLFIGGLLVNHLEGLVVYEFIETYKNELIEKGIDTQKINSVNATLASLASETKQLVEKGKKEYNEKLLTLYKPTQKLIDIINSKEEEK